MNTEVPRIARHRVAPNAFPRDDRNKHVALVAHVLRSPLMPIINAAALLARSPGDAELVRRNATIIDRQSRIISRMIDDLMTMSSVQMGNLRLQRTPVSMATLVRRCLETVEPFAVQRGIRLVVSVSSGPMEIHADALRLGQALQNVLFNAVKYSEPDAEVHLRVERSGSEISITVSDKGVGITAIDLESIFLLCPQADSRKSASGLGIGLYLARHLVEAHGGSLVAASAGPRLGSTFTILLPCLAPVAVAAQVLQDLPSSRSDSFLTTP